MRYLVFTGFLNSMLPYATTSSIPSLLPPSHRYFSMLKSQKVNLVPESEFHNRDERVKAQQSEGEAKTSGPVRSEAAATNGVVTSASSEDKPSKAAAKGKAKEEKTPKAKPEENKVKARESPGAEVVAAGSAAAGVAKDKKHKEGSPPVSFSLAKVRQEAAAMASAEKTTAKTSREKTAGGGGGGGEGKDGHAARDGTAAVVMIAMATVTMGAPLSRNCRLVPPAGKQLRVRSPSGHNGPATSPGRAGQRRQHGGSGTSSPVEVAVEKGIMAVGGHVGRHAVQSALPVVVVVSYCI